VILIIIPVRFVDYYSSTQGKHLFGTVFTNSSAITLQVLYKSTIKLQGAQLNILKRIPVKFHEALFNILSAKHDTS
jgi:hypothetical protein